MTHMIAMTTREKTGKLVNWNEHTVKELSKRTGLSIEDLWLVIAAQHDIQVGSYYIPMDEAEPKWEEHEKCTKTMDEYNETGKDLLWMY